MAFQFRLMNFSHLVQHSLKISRKSGFSNYFAKTTATAQAPPLNRGNQLFCPCCLRLRVDVPACTEGGAAAGAAGRSRTARQRRRPWRRSSPHPVSFIKQRGRGEITHSRQSECVPECVGALTSSSPQMLTLEWCLSADSHLRNAGRQGDVWSPWEDKQVFAHCINTLLLWLDSRGH